MEDQSRRFIEPFPLRLLDEIRRRIEPSRVSLPTSRRRTFTWIHTDETAALNNRGHTLP